MNAAPILDAIHIEVRAEAGRVCGAMVRAGGGSPAARLFRRRDGEDIPALAENIFALCPMAQSTAAACAIAAARGRQHPLSRGQELRLLAERIAENLRSSLLSWPGRAQAPDAGDLMWLRDALGALQALTRQSRDERCGDMDLAPLVARLTNAVRGLGLPSLADAPPAGWFARVWRDATDDRLLCALHAPDEMADAADDDAMFDFLDAGSDAAPPQRLRDLDALARLRARWADLSDAIGRLGRLACGDPIPGGGVRVRATPAGAGVAAVDSPRGRLYHWVAFDRDGRASDYRILSPTDRNFRSNGAFARALTGAIIGEAADGELRVARLAALFDPCVALHVRIEDCADA